MTYIEGTSTSVMLEDLKRIFGWLIAKKYDPDQASIEEIDLPAK